MSSSRIADASPHAVAEPCRAKSMGRALADWLCSRQVRTDAAALSTGLGLFLLLLAMKLHLAWWFFIVKAAKADIQWWKIPLLIGGDMAVCAAMAGVVFVCWGLGLAPRGGWRWALRAWAFAFYAFIVVFSVVSWQVNLVYTKPLTMELIRFADNMGRIRDSLLAYLRPMPVMVCAFGLAGYFVWRWPVWRLIQRGPWLCVRWHLWLVVLLVTASFTTPWFFFCRGGFAYGLKRNAVLNFIQYFSLAPKAVDLEPLRRELALSMPAHDGPMRQAASLVQSAATRPSELAVLAGRARGMNVLLIVLESTAAQYCDQQTTPNLWRLAQTGVSLDRYYSVVPKSDEAMYSILYSDYLPPFAEPVRMLYNRPLPQPSLTTVLKTAGYRTAAFLSGSRFYCDMQYLMDSFHLLQGAEEVTGGQWAWSWGASEEQTLAAIDRYLGESPPLPFFILYVPVFPHHPYFTPTGRRPFGTATWVDKYRNSLQYVDDRLGELVDSLERKGVRDQTLIVVLADHGESISSFPVGHGLALSTEEVWVPCVISNPKLFARPMRCAIPANHLDLAPTLAGLLGLPIPPDWLGRDLTRPQVENRMLFVRVEQSGIGGVIDGDLVVRRRDEEPSAEMFELTPQGQMRPLRDDDPRLSLLPQYAAAVDVLKPWASWRHLERALKPPAPTTTTAPSEAATP